MSEASEVCKCRVAAIQSGFFPLVRGLAIEPIADHLTSLMVLMEECAYFFHEYWCPASTEEAVGFQHTRRKQLKMKMITLNYRNQAELLSELCELLRPVDNDVHSEAEKVLTLWMAADATILKIVPPPTCKLQPAWLSRLYESLNPLDQGNVDLTERADELRRRGGGHQGVL